MKNKFTLRLLIAFAVLFNFVSAQQQEQLSLYAFNPLMFNPAYAGSRGTVNGSVIARKQWAGFNGAPQTGYFSINAPLNDKMLGVGLNVVSDRVGKRNTNSAYASLAYTIKLNKKDHRLCFGLNGGIDMVKYDFNQLTVLDNSDPIYSNTFNYTAFNIGSGIYTYSEKHYIGISCPKILEPSISNLSATTYSVPSLSALKRHFYFMAGYVLPLNSLTKL
jgi:type IX secretion system PorP/SprF family membrane protein